MDWKVIFSFFVGRPIAKCWRSNLLQGTFVYFIVYTHTHLDIYIYI